MIDFANSLWLASDLWWTVQWLIRKFDSQSSGNRLYGLQQWTDRFSEACEF